jgi:hypothetical protein
MVILFLLVIVGVVLISESGMGSVRRPNIGLFVPGLLLVTMAGIFLIGVIFGWRGFEQRFGLHSLLGYWEISGG